MGRNDPLPNTVTVCISPSHNDFIVAAAAGPPLFLRFA
jgi:hypothetical protein